MMNEVKAHGMQGDWVEPDWPLLTLPEVDALLRRFPEAGGAERILSYSPRPFSAASLVSTPKGKVFVKRHHESVRDRAGLQEEHQFLAYLRDRGSSVPDVLADVDDETAIRSGSWIYEVHSPAVGLDVYEQDLSWTPFRSAEHARAAGRAMAELHLAAEGYHASRRNAKTLVASFSIFADQDPWPALERYLAERPSLAEYLSKRDWRAQTEEVLMPFHSRLRGFLRYLRPLWTHNDLHASNLFWTSNGNNAEVASIIDFGLSDRTNAVHDIATAIERNGVSWLELEGDFDNVVHINHIEALLDGYEEVRLLTDAEAQAIPCMLPIVHAEFALSEADYFLRVLHSETNASLAWDGYFLGHADWFRSEAGKRLLEHLGSWDAKRQFSAVASIQGEGNHVAR